MSTGSAHAAATDRPGIEKHSVSIPAAVCAGVRTRVGARGFSAYVTSAVARQLERDALSDIIAGIEAQHGPVEELATQRAIEQLAGPGA